MRSLGLLGFAVAMLCAPLAAQAQDISIQADVNPKQGAVGQPLRLVVSVSGQANLQGGPQLPDLSDFQVYNGGQSSNFSWVNGQVSSSLNFTYVLVPKHAGQFTIGPVQITHAGQTYATQPMTVAIGAASGAPPAASAPPAAGAAPQASAPAIQSERSRGPAFVTTSLDRKNVYVNEPLILSFRFYTRVPVLSQPQYQPADTQGFWAEDLPPQREYTQIVNGNEYRVIEIRTLLFPTTAGSLTIGPAKLTVRVEDFQRRLADPFANEFFRGFFSRGQVVELQSDPLTVNVKPIPQAGRPATFTGAVGKWSLSAKLDRKEAKVNEAVTLEVRIFGEGNVKSVGKLELPPLTGFKVYETISSSEVQKQGDEVRGVKIYRTLLRPEATGVLAIPALTYSYFDPTAGRFEQIQVPSLSLNVLPGDAAPASQAAAVFAPGADGAAPAEGVKLMARDIRYLKTSLPFTPASPPLPGWLWLLGFGLPPLALAGLWGWQRWQDRLAADPRFARRLGADKSARQALRQARRARLRRDAKGFYGQLIQAVNGYLADRLGLSRSGVTQREILQLLRQRRADAVLLDELARLWEECDFARFAPWEPEPAALASHERQAESLLARLGRILSREKRA